MAKLVGHGDGCSQFFGTVVFLCSRLIADACPCLISTSFCSDAPNSAQTSKSDLMHTDYTHVPPSWGVVMDFVAHADVRQQGGLHARSLRMVCVLSASAFCVAVVEHVYLVLSCICCHVMC